MTAAPRAPPSKPQSAFTRADRRGVLGNAGPHAHLRRGRGRRLPGLRRVAFAVGLRLQRRARRRGGPRRAARPHPDDLRTSLVKADANATNAFLVGGLEPTDVRDGYNDGHHDRGRDARGRVSAEPGDAAALEQVNQVLAKYTGLIESARANNRQGFPVGAAYLRAGVEVDPRRRVARARGARRETARRLRRVDPSGVDRRRRRRCRCSRWCSARSWSAQAWLSARTRRIINRPLAAATALVAIGGLLGLVVFGLVGRAATLRATARTPRPSRSRRFASTASTPRAPRA